MLNFWFIRVIKTIFNNINFNYILDTKHMHVFKNTLLILFLFTNNLLCQDLNLKDFQKIKINNDIVYLSRTSGIIFKNENEKWIRLDNSYDDKVHTGSLNFVYKDTLFRFGGYGYFSTNKNLIYFDDITKQWDLVKFKGFKEIEGFSSVGIHFIRNSHLNVIGYDTHENEFQNESNFKHKGFIYNIDKKEVKQLVNLKKSFEFPRSFYQVNNDHVFLFYPTKRKLKILKTSNFDLYNYNLNQVESSIINNNNENFIVDKDELVYTIRTIDRIEQLHRINIDYVLNNMIYEGNILEKGVNYFKFLFLFPLILLVVLIYLRIIKKETILLSNKKLIYKKKTIELTPQMVDVLNKLIEMDEVSNSELNDIFHKEGQNNIHINREKNNCIDKINLIMNLNFQDDLILRKKSDYDKRMVVFFLNKKFIGSKNHP